MRTISRILTASLIALLMLGTLLVPSPAAAAEPVEPPEADEPAVDDTGESADTDDTAEAPVEPEPESAPVFVSTGSGIDDSIARLYYAYFRRQPDPGGLAHWTHRYRRGERLDAISAVFARSPEFQSRYGQLSDNDFVTLVYDNVLGRDPDPSGFQHWTSQLAAGAFSRGNVMAQFSESREHVSITGTLPPEAPPSVVPASSGYGRRIIYCISCQHVWLVEDSGLLVRDYAVSGRVNTPRAGTYQVFSKSPLAWAGHHGITMEYMVRYTWGNTLALGFHSIPKRPNGTFLQTEAELGQYRSAGCTRQRLEDARFLYEWAPVGTTVVVLP